MPAGLDAAFWDPATGSIKFDDLNKEIAALRTAKAEWDNARSAVPESPDKYEFKVPEGFALPEGMSLNTDDPRLPEVRKMAHEARLSQEQFEALIKIDVAAKAMEKQALNRRLEQEQEKLGPDKGKARVEAVVRGLTGAVGEADAKHLVPMMVSAAQVQAFERLLGRVVNQGQATAGYQPGGQAGKSVMSDEEWNRLSPTEKFAMARERQQQARPA